MAADGSIIIKTEVDNKKAQSELQKLEKKIEKIKQEMSRNEGEKSSIEKQLNDAKKAAYATLREIDSLKKNLKKTTAETGGGDPFSEMYRGQIEVANKKLAEQDKALEKIANSYAKITDKVEAQKGELAEAEVEAGKLTAKLAGAGKNTRGMSEAAEAAQQRMGKMSKHIATLAKRIFVFSLITAALRKIKDYMWEAIQTNDEAMAAVARLKGALMTLAQPIINVVIPAFTLMVNVITRIVNAISRLVSLLFGTTIQKSAQGAKALNDQKKGIEGVGEAAKKASKYLASFDELNVMDDQSDTSGGGSAGGGLDDGGGVAPDFTGQISDSLSAIVELFTGAALLGLGAILTFSGANIPLGIALMALGAIAIWDTVTENWDIIKTLLQGPLGETVALIGGALLVIGVVLLFSGVGIPIGLGLILAGATLLGTAAAANWDTIMDILKNPLDHTDVLIRGYKLSLGVALLFSGVGIPIGFGLIKDSLNRSVSATPRWDYLEKKLKEIAESIKSWWKKDVEKYLAGSWWSKLGRGIISGLLLGLTGGWSGVVLWVLSSVKWIVEQFNDAKRALSGAWARNNNIGSGGIGGYHVNVQSMPALRVVDVPALARGAVIPPNREFMAVLGDQKSGTNIETPLETMVQAFKIALTESGYNGSNEAVLMLDRDVLGRVVYRLNKAESTRVGVSLVEGKR